MVRLLPAPHWLLNGTSLVLSADCADPAPPPPNTPPPAPPDRRAEKPSPPRVCVLCLLHICLRDPTAINFCHFAPFSRAYVFFPLRLFLYFFLSAFSSCIREFSAPVHLSWTSTSRARLKRITHFFVSFLGRYRTIIIYTTIISRKNRRAKTRTRLYDDYRAVLNESPDFEKKTVVFEHASLYCRHPVPLPPSHTPKHRPFVDTHWSCTGIKFVRTRNQAKRTNFKTVHDNITWRYVAAEHDVVSRKRKQLGTLNVR